jgi:type I restriction enzyme S subunit
MAFSAVDETKMLHVPAAYGEPPKGWSWSRLDEVSEGVFDCPHSTPKLTDAGPFVVRTQDIITGVFRPDQAGRVSEETYADRVARVTPSYGDLLYSREGTYFGIAAEVPPKTRVCLGQRMVLIRADRHRLDFSFLRHWLNSPIMAAHIHGYRDGSVAERLNLPTIRALPVLIPPLAEQKAIAVVLGALDDKIELNRRMNATLEAMARALFQSWFVDFDPVRAKKDGREPVGLDPGTAALFPDSFQDSSIGHIPSGWEVAELGQIADVIDCLHAKKPERCENGQLYLQLNNIRDDGLIDITDSFLVSEEDYRKWIYRMEARAGDCVITNVGRVGAVGQIPERVKGALGRSTRSEGGIA